jgi:hypothetical protein
MDIFISIVAALPTVHKDDWAHLYQKELDQLGIPTTTCC